MCRLSTLNPNASTRSIIDTSIRNVSQEVIAELPYLKSSKRIVQRRKRNADDRHIKEPTTLAALNPIEFRVFTHKEEELFLAHQSAVDPRSGKDFVVTVFATRSNLQRLQECNVVGSDGTFEVIFV